MFHLCYFKIGHNYDFASKLFLVVKALMMLGLILLPLFTIFCLINHLILCAFVRSSSFLCDL